MVEMDSPLIFIYPFVETFFSDVNDALPQLDWGLNGTVGRATIISLSRDPEEFCDGPPLSIWEWASDPLDYPPDVNPN